MSQEELAEIKTKVKGKLEAVKKKRLEIPETPKEMPKPKKSIIVPPIVIPQQQEESQPNEPHPPPKINRDEILERLSKNYEKIKEYYRIQAEIEDDIKILNIKPKRTIKKVTKTVNEQVIERPNLMRIFRKNGNKGPMKKGTPEYEKAKKEYEEELVKFNNL